MPARGAFSLLTPQRLWEFVRIEGLAVSPDGRQLVLTLAAFPGDSDLPALDLWLVDAAGRRPPRQLTDRPGPEAEACWAPDGRSLVYVAAAAGGGEARLRRLELDSDEDRELLRFPTPPRHPRFLPDGSGLVFEAETLAGLDGTPEALEERLEALLEAEATALATEARLARRGGRAISTRRVRHLFFLDLETGRVRDLMPTFTASVPLAPFEWDLSPDGSLLAFTGLAEGPPWVSRDRELYLLPLAGGAARPLTRARPGSAFGPRFVDQRRLLFGAQRRSDAPGEFTGLELLDLDSGRSRPLTDPRSLSPESWRADPAGDAVLFTAEDRGTRRLFRSALDGRAPAALPSPGSVERFAPGPAGTIHFVASRLGQPGALFAMAPDGGQRRRLTSFNQPLLEATRMGSWERLRLPGHDGHPVESFVIYPPGFDDTRTWPLLLALHGGPHDAWRDEFNFRWNLMTLAAPGYVVVAPNVHGSTGYGQAFAEEILGDPVGAPAEDLRRLLEHLRERPWADGARLGIVGGSYGGYLANWMLAQDLPLATAVVHAGIFELVVQYASDHPWGRARSYGALPWQDPARYRALSPSTHAARMTTPVLLLHGERDTRVPVVHSLMQHNLLTARGVRSRLVLLPEAGHRVDGRRSAERWWAEIFSWLRETLPPGPGEPRGGKAGK